MNLPPTRLFLSCFLFGLFANKAHAHAHEQTQAQAHAQAQAQARALTSSSSCHEAAGVHRLFDCPQGQVCSSWNDGCNDCGCNDPNGAPFCTFMLCPWCHTSNPDCVPVCHDNPACVPKSSASSSTTTTETEPNDGSMTNNNNSTNTNTTNTEDLEHLFDSNITSDITTEGGEEFPSTTAASRSGAEAPSSSSSSRRPGRFLTYVLATLLAFAFMPVADASSFYSSRDRRQVQPRQSSQQHLQGRLPFGIATTAAVRGGGEGDHNDKDDDDSDDSDDNILYPSSLEELNDILLQQQQQPQNGSAPKRKLVVIDFYSPNCPPCEKVAPLYQELSLCDEFENKVVFVKVNVQDQPEIASKYGITGWPTFVFLNGNNGQVMTEIVGGKLAEETLYEWIKLFSTSESK